MLVYRVTGYNYNIDEIELVGVNAIYQVALEKTELRFHAAYRNEKVIDLPFDPTKDQVEDALEAMMDYCDALPLVDYQRRRWSKPTPKVNINQPKGLDDDTMNALMEAQWARDNYG